MISLFMNASKILCDSIDWRSDKCEKIQVIIDGTKQMTRALPSMEVKVDQWDPFVTFIMLSKLDEETQ